jgi:serine/threonine protein kinase/Tfp pilus assembly protein PilF
MSIVPEQLAQALVDTYRIERELGAGGMATVWLARDLRHDRLVALKVMQPELAGAIGVDRFVREVRLTAQLQHANIVPVLDSGVLTTTTGTRLPWYAMPYIAGESLRSRLRREQQLPVETALHITEDVARVLESAHQHGIVHRDIKPENLMLADGTTYVVDFGIAKALIDTGDERLTSTGLALGTPAYMSPEQAAAGVVDERSDQYSLACVLYEMLAGEPPFTGPTAQAVVARRFAETARAIRPVRPAVPSVVERAVLKGLERIPADRFESVAAFAAALRAPDSAETAAFPQRLRRRWLLAVTMAVMAVAALGGALLWRGGDTPRAHAEDPQVVALYRRGLQGYNRRTPEGAREAVGAYSAALRLDSSYAPAWNGLAQMYVQANRRQFAIQGVTWDSMLRLAVAASDRAVALDPGSADSWVTRANVSRAIDPTEVRSAIQSAHRAVALDSSSAPAWHALATNLLDRGDLDSAIATWHQCAARNPAFTQCLAFIALGFYWHRQYDSAAFWVDSTVALDPSYLLGRSSAGYIAIERGDFAKAVASFEAARRVSSDVEAVNALAGRALAEARQGAMARARATLHQVDSMAARYTPLQAHLAVYVAQAHAALGEKGPAETWLERYVPTADLHFQLHLRCDPPFDPLRGDRRFRALLITEPTAGRC